MENVRKSFRLMQLRSNHFKGSLKDLLHEMQITFLYVIRDGKDLPWWRSLFGAILGNHLINFLFQFAK